MKLDVGILYRMMMELGSLPKIYQPSSHWKNLSAIHIGQILTDIGSFKRTVNKKYFNWGILGIVAHQLLPVFSEMASGNLSPFFKGQFLDERYEKGNGVKSFGDLTAFLYKNYVAYLYDYVLKVDKLNILKNTQEPLVGGPYAIKYKGSVISQDLCNSVHEFYRSTKEFDKNPATEVADIGAGYGRLAYVFLKTLPYARYTIIDIPPALYLAQEYLSEIFKKEKIFLYRNFTSYKNVKKEFEESRIRLLLANQIELLPDKSFDLVISVSSFHEMSRPQIKNYLKQVQRLSRGYLYIKEWRRSRVRDNDHISESKYPIPKSWETIFRHPHPIQRLFFEALYRVE